MPALARCAASRRSPRSFRQAALSSREEVAPDMRILLFDGLTTLQALAPGEVLLRLPAQEDRRCE